MVIRTASAVGNGATASLPAQIDSVTLADGTDFSALAFEVKINGHAGGAANNGNAQLNMYEASVEADF